MSLNYFRKDTFWTKQYNCGMAGEERREQAEDIVQRLHSAAQARRVKSGQGGHIASSGELTVIVPRLSTPRSPRVEFTSQEHRVSSSEYSLNEERFLRRLKAGERVPFTDLGSSVVPDFNASRDDGTYIARVGSDFVLKKISRARS